MKHPFTEFPKFLHHETGEPIVAHNAAEEQAARDAGYTEDYVHKPYPKHVERPDGATVAVANEDEEKAALAQSEEKAAEE